VHHPLDLHGEKGRLTEQPDPATPARVVTKGVSAMMSRVGLACIAVISLSGCRAQHRPPTGQPTVGSLSRSAIRAVDFRNFTYPTTCFTGSTVRVVAGRAEKDEDNRAYGFTVDRVRYADLTGDGTEEALVVATCVYPGGSSAGWTEAYVYGMKGVIPGLSHAGQ
jgi:hypothetical protein